MSDSEAPAAPVGDAATQQLEFVRISAPVPGVALVTLDRPSVNALNTQAYVEIKTAFQSLASMDVNVAVLTGAGHVFSAGKDLNETLEQTADDASSVAPRDAFWALYDCAVPVIAAVNGAAVGSGFALVSCCDMVVSVRDAKFSLPELRAGLLGGAKFGARLLGEMAMRRMLFTAEPYSAEDCVRLGLAIDLVDDRDDLMEHAMDLAGQVASHSTVAVRLAKAALRNVEELPLQLGYAFEQRYTIELRNRPESRAATLALLRDRSSGAVG